MAEPISLRKGFTSVDQQPEPERLVEGMRATAEWPAVMQLRDWERERLKVESGDQILDVGCGGGEVVTELAAFVEPDGRAVGLDASEQMLAAARVAAEQKSVAVELHLGDATNLPFDDDTFTATRSERTLQWVADPAAVVREMFRVTRPGGRICIIDTDWRTLLPDHPSQHLVRRFLDAMAAVRGDQATVGSRLVNFLRDVGAVDVEATAATHMWLEWDPDTSDAPAGMFPLRFVGADIVAQGLLEADELEQMVSEFEQRARDGRMFTSLTMFAAAGRKPGA